MENFKIVQKTMEYDTDYNDYYRGENNRKIKKEDNGDRYYAIAKDGSFHRMEREDMASKMGDGVYAVEKGTFSEDDASYPIENGEKIIIFGATENSVYADSKHERPVQCNDIVTDNKVVVVSRNNPLKAAREFCRARYVILENAMKELGAWGNRL